MCKLAIIRFYWISWVSGISVGLGTDATQNTLLKRDEYLNVTFRFLSISTSVSSAGTWTFPSGISKDKSFP